MNFSTIPFLHQLYKFKWIPGSKSYKIMIWSTDNPPVEMIRHIINVKKSNSPQCPSVLHDPKLKKSFTWRGNLRSVFHPLIFPIFFDPDQLCQGWRFFMFLCWVLYVFVGTNMNHYTPKIEQFAPWKFGRAPKGKDPSSSPIIFQGRTVTLQGTNISPKNGILKMIFLFPRWDMLIPWRVNFGGVSSPWLHHGWFAGTVSWDAPSNFIEAWLPSDRYGWGFPQATRVFKMDGKWLL